MQVLYQLSYGPVVIRKTDVTLVVHPRLSAASGVM